MTTRRRVAELMLPWSGLIGAVLGWGLAHQIGSNLDSQHCEAMSPLVALLIGLAGLAIAGGGGLLSWRHHKRGEAAGGARHFVSLLGVLAAALFSVALVWQTLSSLIIPRCYG
jgi:hypothetical protein